MMRMNSGTMIPPPPMPPPGELPTAELLELAPLVVPASPPPPPMLPPDEVLAAELLVLEPPVAPTLPPPQPQPREEDAPSPLAQSGMEEESDARACY